MQHAHARIRVSRRVSYFAGVFSLGKTVIFFALIIALVLGAAKYIQHSRSAFALQFTQHVVGTKTGAVGVLGVAIGDMQNDGRQDIVTAGYDGVKVYTQTAAKVFEVKVVDDVRGERIYLRDFNDDDLLDILITADSNPSVRVYINQGNTNFSKTWLGTGSKAAAAAGDINGDGAIDIVTSMDQGSGDYLLQRWMNSGGGVFTSTTLATASGITALAIADINSTGYNNIIAGGTEGLQHWDTSNGTTWSRADIDSSQTKFTAFALGDVNGDDKVDIIAGNQSDNTVTYYQHLQHAYYTKISLSKNTDAASMQVVDFNEDGYTDIVATSQDENKVYWFQNDGKQSFTRHTIASGLQSVFDVAAGDIDADGDFDFVAGDHVRGTLYWYERTHAKPAATAPAEIAQMTDGSGRVLFTTTISQEDLSRTSLRVEYSIDGVSWHKAYLTSVKPSTGKVDINHDSPYQIGTSNPIDTDLTGSVKLTITWDTKSTKNLGGPISGDQSAVQIKLIPKDSVGLGQGVKSAKFAVDNQIPATPGSLSISGGGSDSAQLAWSAASDRTGGSYRIYYGTDSDAVKNQTSSVWDNSDDDALEETATTTTTISDLSAGSLYTFKLIFKDGFGNESALPSVSATIGSAAILIPTPAPEAATSPLPLTSDAAPEPSATLLPTPTPIPSTTDGNEAPVADAGADQAVNPSALVILDSSGSYDGEGGLLTHAWTQLSGPEVDLVSNRTINPSFSAGGEDASYVFQVTVKDANGASAVDLVTVAVRSLPQASAVPVAAQVSPLPSISPEVSASASIRTLPIWGILSPINIGLFALSIALILISFIGHAVHGVRARDMEGGIIVANTTSGGSIVHYKTGKGISGAQAMVYSADGKLRSNQKANAQGQFLAVLPQGEYTINVRANGFVLASDVADFAHLERSMLYTGGTIAVTDSSKPLDITIPMKPSREEVGSFATALLHGWQNAQMVVRAMSWPVFILGSLINTVRIFLQPDIVLLGIEAAYVVFIIAKVIFEMRARPAYGLVRDALTHAPLDLAVVRLFNQKTNQLVMTRVANSEGKFFALPPAGTYMISITKPGYGSFSREGIIVESGSGSVLTITSDLMPLVPQGGYATV